MTLHRSNKMTLWLLAVAFTILAVAILATSAMTVPAEAQDPDGSINNLLVSSPNPGQLLITWDSPAEVPTDYRVRWAPSNQDYLSYSAPNEANRGSEYPNGQDTSMTLTNLSRGSTFKVQIRTRYETGGDNNGPWSGPWTDEFTQRVNDDPPAAPTGLTTSQITHDSVTLSWTAPSRGAITGYSVLRGADTNSMTAIVADSGSTSTQYTDSSVAPETAYVYAVQALSPDGNGTRSETTNVTTTAPPPPTVAPTPVPASDELNSLTLASDTAGQLAITWNQPSDEPTDYRIMWAPADEDYLSYSAENTDGSGNSYPAGDVTTLTLTGLPGGSTYKVMMRARYHDAETNEYSSGPWTSDVTQRVRNNPPAAPTELSLTETTSKDQTTSIDLTWNAPSHDDLTGYRIWRGVTPDSLTELVQDTASIATSYSDATTETDGTYVYAVTALSLDGDSPRSTTMSITRAAAGTTTRDAPTEEEPLIAQQQQSSHVMVSNLATGAEDISLGTAGYNQGRNREVAAQVTTGRHPTGYTVSAIRATVHSIIGTVADLSPKLYIHADDNGKPGAVLHTLTTSTGLVADSTLEFTASGITLQPSTKYWLMFADDTTTSSYLLRASSSLAEEPCGELDWSIGNKRYLRVDGTLHISRFLPLAVAVVGSQVDDGTLSELECTDTDAATTTYTKILMGGTAIGALQTGDDKDWFAVTLEADVDYQFDIYVGIDGGGNSLISGGINGVYNSSGTAQTIHKVDVDPEIKLFIDRNNTPAWYEKRRAYFEPTVGGTYYLEVGPDSHDSASLGGGTYAQSQPTYTVRVREADVDITRVPVGDSITSHFYTEHGEGNDIDVATALLTSGQTYWFTLTGHATANTQMRILQVLDSNSEKVADGADANRYSNTVSMLFTPSATGLHQVELTSREHGGNTRHPAPDYTFSVVETVKLSFGEAAYSVNEGSEIRIPVTLSKHIGYALIPIIVTPNGGATKADYGISHEKAYFRTLASMTITVYAQDDSDNDDNESITLSFGELPDGVVGGTHATTTITIVDNDS